MKKSMKSEVKVDGEKFRVDHRNEIGHSICVFIAGDTSLAWCQYQDFADGAEIKSRLE